MLEWIDDILTKFMESEKEEMSFDINPTVLSQFLAQFPDGENRILTKLALIQNTKGIKILTKRDFNTGNFIQINFKKESQNNG